jgi:hypothetical protein
MPSGLGGTPSTASLGPGGTGPFIQSLRSGRGGTRASNGQCRRVSNPSGGLWKAAVGCEVSGRSAVVRQRQQTGAPQTLREVEGAVGSRGSAWTAAACRRCVCWSGVEPDPPQASRGRRLCLKLPVLPNEGTASTPSGSGGTRSTASDGGAPSTASLGPGGTGHSMESLPSARGGTRASNGQCRRVSNPSGGLWKAGAGCEVSGRSAVVRQRQQAGALQTLREVEGAVGSRGSAWTAAACRRCVCLGPGLNPALHSIARPTTLLETANPPNEGMAFTPSGLGGTPSTASPLNGGSLCPREMPRFPQRTS